MTEWITFHEPSWVHAVAPGNAHRARGIPSQDAVSVKHHKDWLLAALADGAGSAREAHAGAWFVTKRMIERMTDIVDGREPRSPAPLFVRKGRKPIPQPPPLTMLEKLRREFTGLRSDMADLARENGRFRDDYATTLLVVMCNVVKGTTYLLQIGDGAIIAGKPWRLAFPPHRGPSRCYTRFVTDPDATSHVHVAQLPTPPDTIVMLSDGLTDITMNERELTLHEPFYDFVDDLMRKPESRPLEGDVTSLLTSLIDGPDVRSITADDTSLVVLSRIPKLRPASQLW